MTWIWFAPTNVEYRGQKSNNIYDAIPGLYEFCHSNFTSTWLLFNFLGLNCLVGYLALSASEFTL